MNGQDPPSPQFLPRGRIFRRYVVAFVSVVCGVLLASGLVAMYFGYQESRRGIFLIQQEKAKAAALKIEQFVKEIEDQLWWTANAPWTPTKAGLEQRRLDFLKLQRRAPAITELRQLDQSGREQLRVSRVEIDVFGSHTDLWQDPKFTEARTGKTYFGPVYFRSDSEPYISIAMPGVDPERGVTVTVAEVNLKFVWDVVNLIRIGQAGYAYVVDRQGILIAHPDIALVLKRTSLHELPQVARARAASSGRRGDSESGIGRDLSGHRTLSSHVSSSVLGWTVFAEQSLGEAFEPLYAVIYRTLGLLLAGLAFSVVASLVLAQRLVRPIRTLQSGAARIASGALDHRVAIRTGDELEVLAEEFNSMANQLQESYASLERRVVEQTAQLQPQATQLAEWNRTLEQRVTDQLRELERISRLKRFLSPQLAELITSSTEERILESHRREITVVFCDLRAFTAFSETAEPEDVMGTLQEFHGAMGELIFRFEGTLERFAGDGLMVFFNDPLPCQDPAARAVRMAVAMRERVRQLSQTWRKRGHELGFGVGIALGYATLGKIGFEGRFDYGAIGTVTNLASRLCDEARPGQILISQRVYAMVEDLVEAEPAGEFHLKGFVKLVPAFNILTLKESLA